MKPRISIKGRIFIQNNVRIVIEKNGRLIVGKNVVIKNNTIIYVKENALLEIGNETRIRFGPEFVMGHLMFYTIIYHYQRLNFTLDIIIYF